VFTGHGQPITSQYDMPERYAHTNYLGTINLVEAAIKATSVRQFVYAFCYDEDTFAYTLEYGLKHYSELTVGERVLSVTTDGRTEIDRVTAIHASPYDGELLYFAGRRVDLLVTPNHRMLFMGRGKIPN